MFDNVYTIGEEKPEFQADYQSQILEHWQQIQCDKRYPSKEDFRPQQFPKHLPKIAIVSVEDAESFSGRLTGETVSEVLRLEPGREKLVAAADENISLVVRAMLARASENERPTYFKGKFRPELYSAIGFSALVLPFSYEDQGDQMDALLLAFDFDEQLPIGIIE